MKKFFSEPQLEIIQFTEEDLINTKNTSVGEFEGEEDEWGDNE